MIGSTPIEAAVEHAMRFVDAIPAAARRVLDLGSGGGLPGLVIAWHRPELQVTLVDRRAKRTDLLERLIRRLGIDERTQVLTADVADLAGHPEHRASYDVVTARSFAPPLQTLAAARPFLAPGAVLIVSDPPASRRWVELDDPAGALGEAMTIESSGDGLTVLLCR
jgi:16S rRNA (guanine527-N7)-methyltransferase